MGQYDKCIPEATPVIHVASLLLLDLYKGYYLTSASAAETDPAHLHVTSKQATEILCAVTFFA